jgi:hypothetical protein
MDEGMSQVQQGPDDMVDCARNFQIPVVKNQNVIVGNTGTVNTGGELATFVFTQPTPLSAWSITHNLGGFPSVTLTDPSGNVIIAQLQYISNSQVLVTFSQPVAGLAYLNI